jgi:response regulator RpfG family c-di-GMP phosphodiesterase
MLINCDSLALERASGHVTVVAATGQFSVLVGSNVLTSLPDHLLKQVGEVLKTRRAMRHLGEYWGYFRTHSGKEHVIYLHSQQPLSDDDSSLIELFLQNVSIAYENNLLYEEINATQRDIVYMLGEAIETRSRETGQHVRRVAEYSYLIAKGVGLAEREAQVLKIAAPLHDFGKIGIPDAILHKPGKLDGPEWMVMRTHAEIGREMLGRSNREILQVAALLAGHHHEKWDGSGYPQGLRGEEIHLYGRIGAVADVFDALGSRRSYKEPWTQEQIIAHLREQRGIHFDPVIVDWVLAHMDEMMVVSQGFPDSSH